MNKNLRVEARKSMKRWDFYIISVIFLIIPIIINYNLSIENSNINLTTTASSISYLDLYGILLGILQHSGLLIVLIIISSWSILGKEKDDGIFNSLFLFSKNKRNVYFSKVLILLLQYVMFTLIMFLSYHFSFSIFEPKNIDFKFILSDFCLYTIAFLLFVIFFVALAFLGTILSGSIGMLCNTGGLFVVFMLLKNYDEIDKYIPTVLLEINLDESLQKIYQNFSIVLIYIVLIFGIAILKIIKNRKGD